MKGVMVCYNCLAREHGYPDPKSMFDDLIWGKRGTTTSVGRLLGIHPTTVVNAMKFYGSKGRSKGAAGRPSYHAKKEDRKIAGGQPGV